MYPLITHEPACDRARDAAFQLSGCIGDYLAAVTDQWLCPAPYANPAILDMFRDRDRKPWLRRKLGGFPQRPSTNRAPQDGESPPDALPLSNRLSFLLS